ncbi:hypothetical protein P4T89_19300 [Bacillus nakamurai]|uniref:SMODS and SLOG-associating 2TM effector domain-containing protein n=1 Tax=Bacillus nakamurai TaxID=1793963 RepID=A0A150F498_9BACI|nr:hypothetical protein [Bacillus nakamurai]KXZ16397.1 hypothetical protein AXI58_19950 [Bacillus nakamurai]MED1229620.1 hypothetical protein [Bacillus nakamurai]
MEETNQIKEFGEIKDVLNYLEEVKDDLHDKSLSEQIEFRYEIKKRHDKEQIRMFIGRLEDQFELNKAKSYLITALFAIASLFIGSMMKFYVSILSKSQTAQFLAPIIILLFFLTLLGLWGKLSIDESGRLRKIIRYKRLLQECLDEMPEKRHFRRRV